MLDRRQKTDIGSTSPVFARRVKFRMMHFSYSAWSLGMIAYKYDAGITEMPKLLFNHDKYEFVKANGIGPA